jgi:tRNA(fMet)-specific endonuclease VapC
LKYLLDSNTCIRYLNGRSRSIVDHVKATPPGEIAVCSIVKGEMFFGARRSVEPEKARAKQEEFFSLFVSLPFDDLAADIYSDIRAELAAIGTPIGPNDTMIAAIALVHNLKLVTHNLKEFSRVRNLQLEDWEAD